MFNCIKRKFIFTYCLACLLFSLSGCIYLVVGGIGALGGYVVSPDTVEGISENSQDDLWDAAVEITSIMGTVDVENRDVGMIKASIQKAKITIMIIPISDKAVKISVKARKSFFPKISLAQDVFVKIMSKLE